MSTQLPGQIKAYTITVQFCSIIHLQAQADHASKTKLIDTHSHQKKCCVMDFPTVCGLCPYSIEPIPKLNSVRNGNKIDICVQDNINERYRKSKCDMTPFCFKMASTWSPIFQMWPSICSIGGCSQALSTAALSCSTVLGGCVRSESVLEVAPNRFYWVKVWG